MNKFLLTVLLASAAYSAQAATLSVSGTNSNFWPVNGSGIQTTTSFTFLLSDNSGAFSSTSFDLALGTYIYNGNYAAIGAMDPSIGVTLNPEPQAGDTVDATHFTPYHPTSTSDSSQLFQHPSANISGDGSLGFSGTYGAGNYIGFSLLDSNSQMHYGWMDYSLTAPSDGGVALTFLSGYIDDTPNEAVTVGQPSQVPEPSSFALLAGALALAPLLCRRFQRSAKA